MKNCVIYSLMIFLLCVSINQGAAQIRFGAKAGLNLARQNWKGFGGGVLTKFLPTYMIGGVVEYDFSEYLGMGTGLQLQGKGTRDESYKTYISYLQVPVQLQYRNTGWFAGLGPYFAYALGGKYKTNGNSINLQFGNSEEDDFTSIDYGVTLEVGYEYRQIRGTVSYSESLANNIPQDVRKNYSEGALLKNAVLELALTVLFEE